MLMPDQKRILTKVLNPERKIMNYPEGKGPKEAGETELMLMPDQKRILTKVLNPERKIMNYPEGKGPKKIEEYLKYIQRER